MKIFMQSMTQANKENVQYNSCGDCELSYLINSDAYKIHRYSHETRADLSEDPFLESRIVQESIRAFSNDGSYVERKNTKFICTDCPHSFQSWDDLIEHSAQHGIPSNSLPMVHMNEGNNTSSNNSTSAKHIGKPHKCELCYKSFASEERLSVGF